MTQSQAAGRDATSSGTWGLLSNMAVLFIPSTCSYRALHVGQSRSDIFCPQLKRHSWVSNQPLAGPRRLTIQTSASPYDKEFSANPVSEENLRAGVPRFAASSKPIPQSAVEQWMQDVENENPTIRLRAVLGCKDLSPRRAAPILTKLFDSGETNIQNRSFAALFLGYKPNDRSFEILSQMARSVDEADEVRANAVAGLGYLRDPRSIPTCLLLLRNSNTHWSTRATAAVSVGMIVEENRDFATLAYDDLVTALRGTSSARDPLVTACIGALGEVGDARCVWDIAQYLDAEDFSLAQCACEALGQIPGEVSEQFLRELIQNSNVHVNVLWAAELALKKLKMKSGS